MIDFWTITMIGHILFGIVLGVCGSYVYVNHKKGNMIWNHKKTGGIG